MSSRCVVIDPGHGGEADDVFRQGPSGEREEWINLRVAFLLEELLLEKGAQVVLTRRTDERVSLEDRVAVALESRADIFFSIHHNSADPVDPLLNYASVFTHGHVDRLSLNGSLAFFLGQQFASSRRRNCFVDSDQIVFPEGFHVLRALHGKIPAVLGEYSFFSHPGEERRLKGREYCKRQAQSYLKAAEKFVGGGNKYSSTASVWPFELRELCISRRKFLLEKGQTSWRDCWKEAQDFIERGDELRAAEELLNSLALLKTHPEFLEVMNFFSHCGWHFPFPLSVLRVILPCV